MNMKSYHINIFFSEEDAGFIADIPDLAHCSSFGETPGEKGDRFIFLLSSVIPVLESLTVFPFHLMWLMGTD